MDISLSYEEYGEGEPLIFLHGNGDDRSYFSGQIPYFSESFHVIAPDTRGHGKTPRGTAPFTLSQFADDLLAFLDEHGWRRVHLVGFSDGGNIALLFALRYPERLRSLVICGANIQPRGIVLGFRMKIRLSLLRLSLSGKEDAPRRAELLRLMTDEPHIKKKELSALHLPVLVVAGTHDLIRRHHTRSIAKAIPDAKLVLLEGSHCVAREDPEAFNRTLSDFLMKL